jgi:hypothetical protein
VSIGATNRPAIVYGLPSLRHGTFEVLVFTTLKETGRSTTLAAAFAVLASPSDTNAATSSERNIRPLPRSR